VRKAGLEVPDTVSSVAELIKHVPKGSSRTRIFAAVQGCAELSPGLAVPKSTTSVTAYKQAFVNFVSCMRAHGVNLPSPNTSGKGPLLDTKGTDTTSAQYKAAIATCSSIVSRVLSLPTIKKP
jgi:hypothetical protein